MQLLVFQIYVSFHDGPKKLSKLCDCSMSWINQLFWHKQSQWRTNKTTFHEFFNCHQQVDNFKIQQVSLHVYVMSAIIILFWIVNMSHCALLIMSLLSSDDHVSADQYSCQLLWHLTQIYWRFSDTVSLYSVTSLWLKWKQEPRQWLTKNWNSDCDMWMTHLFCGLWKEKKTLNYSCPTKITQIQQFSSQWKERVRKLYNFFDVKSTARWKNQLDVQSV